MFKKITAAFLCSCTLWGCSGGPTKSESVAEASDKVMLIMGQDTTTLREYKKEALDQDTSIPAPSGVTLYSSILPKVLDSNNTAPEDATLYVAGIEGNPANFFNGEVNFHETIPAYEEVNQQRGNGEVEKIALAVGLYASDSWASGEDHCANKPLRALLGTGELGTGDPNDPTSDSYQWRYGMDRLLTWLKEQERPVFFRLTYEFDGSWYCYDKELLKKVFIYVKDRINAMQADNIALVWQAATFPNNDERLPAYRPFPEEGSEYKSVREYYESWYPVREDGTDDVVDYVALSYFAGSNYLDYQWSCQVPEKSWTVPEGSPRVLQDTLLELARDHGKPLMIAESAPQGIDLEQKDWSCVAFRTDHHEGHKFENMQQVWDAWYKDYFDWIEQNKDTVKVVSYINTDWQSQRRWFCEDEATGCPEGYWGITSVQDQPELLKMFKEEVSKPHFLNAPKKAE